LIKEDVIHIAIFGKPRGLEGEIKIIIKNIDYETFKKIKSYFLDGNKKIDIKSTKKIKDNIFVKIINYSNRTEVQKLVGNKIYTYKKLIPKLKKNEYYNYELIGCDIRLKNNTMLGKIIRIDNFGAGDLIFVKNKSRKEFYIPMNKENILSVNLNNNVVFVNPITGILD